MAVNNEEAKNEEPKKNEEPPVVDVDLEAVHDQLPSVEEIRMSSQRSNSSSSSSGFRIGRCGEVALITLAAVFIALIVGLAVGLSKREPPNSTAAPAVDPTPEEPRVDQVIDFLSSQGVSDHAKLQEAGSPQNWAVKWLSDEDTLYLPLPNSTKTLGGVQFVTRYVAALIYHSLGGPNWEHQLKFLSESETCEWSSIDVSAQGQEGRFFRVGVACTNGVVNTLQMREYTLEI